MVKLEMFRDRCEWRSKVAWGEVGIYYRTVCTQLKDHVKAFRRNETARSSLRVQAGATGG